VAADTPSWGSLELTIDDALAIPVEGIEAPVGGWRAPLDFSIELTSDGAVPLRTELPPGEYQATCTVTPTEAGGLLIAFRVSR
jgi:hypothetical protein